MKSEILFAPHIRYHESTRTLMNDVLLTLLFIYGMGLYYYGPRVLILMLLSCITAVVADVLCIMIGGKRPHMRDLSALVTGMLLPLLMPASVPYHVVVVAALFAIIVAKHPFGGVGHNVFNPAAAGFAFVAISFSDVLFAYPAPLQHLPLNSVLEFSALSSPAFTLELGGVPPYDLLDMALGNYPGPMGATNILVIVACLLYLVFRNTVQWEIPVFFFAAVAGFAFLFPRMGLHPDAAITWMQFTFSDRFRSILFEMMSGMLLLGGVFMLSDPVTVPKRRWARIVFAAVAGVVVMLFRRYGRFEEEFVFAILLMNATVWGFDMGGEHIASRIRRKHREAISGKKLQKKA